MVGETEENWQRCVEKTLELAARQRDHLPDGAALQHDDQQGPAAEDRAVRPGRSPTGTTKRRWVAEAFDALERAGYHIGSAYTAVKDPARTQFVYRDRLWQGADLVGLGVASFGHVNGVHVQNLDTWETYSDGDASAASCRSAARTGPTRRGADDPRAGAAAEARVGSGPRTSATSTAWTSSRASASQFASLAARGLPGRGRAPSWSR